MNTGYKVVRLISNTNEYKPVMSFAYQGIKYIQDQPTMQDKNKFGPMTVFSSLISAQQFANDMSHLPGITIFKIRYTQSDEEVLWKKEGKIIKTKKVSGCPKGTILASSVTLLEELKIKK